jgi:hypothetical protein
MQTEPNEYTIDDGDNLISTDWKSAPVPTGAARRFLEESYIDDE